MVKFGKSLRIALKLHESSSGALKSSDTISGNQVEELEGNIQGSAIGLFSELDPSLKKSAERLKKGFIYEKIALVDMSVLDTNNQKSLSKLENEKIEIPEVQSSEVKGINFGSVNVDALQAYQDAVDAEKNNKASILDKKQAWEKVAQFDPQSDLARLAKDRIQIWHQKIQNDAYQKVIDFDQSNASTHDKINQWENLAKEYPSYQNIAQQRISEWHNWQLQEDQKLRAYEKIYEQMISVEKKRSQKRDEDWRKLSKLLKLTVISEDDKNSWVEAFIEAYGVHELLNPYYLQLDPKYRQVVQERYDEILIENRVELKNRLLVLTKAPLGFWENRDLVLWNLVVWRDVRESDIDRLPKSLQDFARLEMSEMSEEEMRGEEEKQMMVKDQQTTTQEKLKDEKSKSIVQMLKDETNFEWILIEGGSFMMGNEDAGNNEKPAHSVEVKSFYISKTEITVAQYKKCVEASVCSAPREDEYCNWNKWFRDDHPINCVDWKQARTFARWIGADLPSEVQWEYAARSGGKDLKYPWGNTEATCEYAVMYDRDDGGGGCGVYRTWEVCSKTQGNTLQGLCDMAGNVVEWVLDEWHGSYLGAPSHGIGWCSDRGCERNPLPNRVGRGGGWNYYASSLRATDRNGYSPDDRLDHLGFRISDIVSDPKTWSTQTN